jgi:threonyl-tRNA synthetase
MEIIREAMDESGLPYVESDGEAAFYGPKIDFIIESVVGNEYAISTNQLDFLASERFNLGYAAEDDSMQPVYVIHRAPLGSHERFTAFLIEHYAGAFPTWLAPEQVRVLSVAERHAPRVLEIRDKLFQADIFTATGGLRVEADVSNERLPKKIRDAQLQKVPYILVVGDTEVESGAVSVRLRSGDSLGVISVDALLERLRGEIRTRRDTPKA